MVTDTQRAPRVARTQRAPRVARTQRAPRVARERTNFAAASAGLTQYPAPQRALLDLRMSGDAPFPGTSREAAINIIGQAYSFASILADAVGDNAVAFDRGEEAVRGVASLLAVAAFLLEDGQ